MIKFGLFSKKKKFIARSFLNTTHQHQRRAIPLPHPQEPLESQQAGTAARQPAQRRLLLRAKVAACVAPRKHRSSTTTSTYNNEKLGSLESRRVQNYNPSHILQLNPSHILQLNKYLKATKVLKRKKKLSWPLLVCNLEKSTTAVSNVLLHVYQHQVLQGSKASLRTHAWLDILRTHQPSCSVTGNYSKSLFCIVGSMDRYSLLFTFK